LLDRRAALGHVGTDGEAVDVLLELHNVRQLVVLFADDQLGPRLLFD
jgi:hypothetical protein